MKKIFTLLFLTLVSSFVFSQATVLDYDGNVYNTVTIGTQTWLKENLRSTHYSDGSLIPDVVTYDNNESYAATYGRLYTWYAAMKNSTVAKVQGACPDGWHVASADEWLVLENYLGGSAVAGGKMKTTTGWKSPNTGATNSSGMSILPGGEYDAWYSPNQFRLFDEYAVIWTSTQINTQKAREKFIAFESAECSIYDWYKVMKYSVRCIKTVTTSDNENLEQKINIYPTLVKDQVRILNLNDYGNPIFIKVYNVIGEVVVDLLQNETDFTIDFSNLNEGFYVIKVTVGADSFSKKIYKSI